MVVLLDLRSDRCSCPNAIDCPEVVGGTHFITTCFFATISMTLWCNQKKKHNEIVAAPAGDRNDETCDDARDARSNHVHDRVARFEGDCVAL